jgi:kinesin family protein 5
MFGDIGGNPDNEGIIPRMCESIFDETA